MFEQDLQDRRSLCLPLNFVLEILPESKREIKLKVELFYTQQFLSYNSNF